MAITKTQQPNTQSVLDTVSDPSVVSRYHAKGSPHAPATPYYLKRPPSVYQSNPGHQDARTIEAEERKWVARMALRTSRRQHPFAATDQIDAHAQRIIDANEEEKRNPTYAKKVRHTKKAGHVMAIIIAAIDGVITAIAIGGVTLLAAGGWPLALIIGLCGFMANRVVYWRSVPKLLHQIFVDGFFSGLNKLQKNLISFSLLFAATLGAGFAALALKSMIKLFGLLVGLPELTMAAAFALNPFITSLIAGLAIVYFIANTSLFFYSLSNLIRPDAHGNGFFKRTKNFFAKLFSPDPSKPKVEQILQASFQILFMVAGFGLAILAAYAILGKLSASSGQLIAELSNVNKEAATIAAKVIVFGFGSIARFAFSIESAVGAFVKVGKVLGTLIYQTGWALGHWSTAKRQMSTAWQCWKTKQSQQRKGQSWRLSWQEWRQFHATTIKQGSLSERINCYTDGFKHALKNLPKIRLIAWVAGGIWFTLHVPTILANAVGVAALGGGGGPHIHDAAQFLGIPLSSDDAITTAMSSAGVFSASLGMYKYMDLTVRQNDGTRKVSKETKQADKADAKRFVKSNARSRSKLFSRRYDMPNTHSESAADTLRAESQPLLLAR